MGRLGGRLAHVRPDDLAAHAIGGLLHRHPDLDRAAVEDVVWGAANQAGEDNRNVGRMAVLLAGLPIETGGLTVNRLCGSGMQAVITAAHALADGWGEIMIAGGSESMSRAPYVMAKPNRSFPTGAPEVADSTLGWRFVNTKMSEFYGMLSMGETAEVVAEKYGITREEQDRWALRSHQRAVAAVDRLAEEIVPIEAPGDHRMRSMVLVKDDEGPRPDTSLEALARLPAVFRAGGSVTAGNSSPLNDGAAALLLATEEGLAHHGLTPLARLVASGAAGVHPDVMGIGPVPASRKAMARAGITADDVELVELNEAFAAQSEACRTELGFEEEIVNVNGGAIALGHPLGASGARLVGTLVHELGRRQARYGLAAMCIGVGQGIAVVVERV
jgi:3-oxoadipyl-CoA thiolase